MQAKSSLPAILVIETVKFRRRSLCRHIRAAGADLVVEALDLQDAAHVLDHRRHAEWIVIADPDLLGRDALASLKMLAERFPVVATLLLTQRKDALEELRAQARHAGLRDADVLRKPISVEEVAAVLHRFRAVCSDAPAGNLDLTREELSACLRSGNLRARFQPRIELASGRPLCSEALPHVIHPLHGVVPATRFAHALAQLSAQRIMTASVLRDAAELVRRLRSRGIDQPVAVPLAAEVLCEAGDAASLDAYVRTLGIAAADLSLGIDPGSDRAYRPVIAENLARLRIRGYRLTLQEDAPDTLSSDPLYAHFCEIKLRPAPRLPAPGDPDIALRVAATLVAARKHEVAVCAIDPPSDTDLYELHRAGFASVQGERVAAPMTMDEILVWVEHEEQARSFAVATTKSRAPATDQRRSRSLR